MIVCMVRDCQEPAVNIVTRTGRETVDWATCKKHEDFVHPLTEHHGRHLSVSGGVIRQVIADTLLFRLDLSRERLKPKIVEEISWDVLDALFEREAIRYMISDYLSERIKAELR